MQQQVKLTAVLVCVALAAASQVAAFEYKSCDKGASKHISASIKGCEDTAAEACRLKAGDYFVMNTTFITHNAFEEATMMFDVQTSVGNYIPLATVPACELGIKCPSKAEQTQSLALQFQIPETFVGLGPNFDFKLASAARDEFCVQFPLDIKE